MQRRMFNSNDAVTAVKELNAASLTAKSILAAWPKLPKADLKAKVNDLLDAIADAKASIEEMMIRLDRLEDQQARTLGSSAQDS